jgi:hypothetical protein
MKYLPKSVPIAALLVVATGVCTVGAARNVNAHERCRPVRAHVHTTLTAVNCASPVNICTTGVIDGGPFHGATSFFTFNAAPSAGMPGTEAPENLSYSGTFSVTQADGTFESADLGVLDQHSAELFTEMVRPLSGTGRFSHPSGQMFISGAIVENNTAFDGFLTGEICTDRGRDNDE